MGGVFGSVLWQYQVKDVSSEEDGWSKIRNSQSFWTILIKLREWILEYFFYLFRNSVSSRAEASPHYSSECKLMSIFKKNFTKLLGRELAFFSLIISRSWPYQISKIVTTKEPSKILRSSIFMKIIRCFIVINYLTAVATFIIWRG